MRTVNIHIKVQKLHCILFDTNSITIEIEKNDFIFSLLRFDVFVRDIRMHWHFAKKPLKNRLTDMLPGLKQIFKTEYSTVKAGVSNSKLYTGYIEKENVFAGRRLK